MIFKKKTSEKKRFSGSYYFDGYNDEKVRERKKRENGTMKRMIGLMLLITVAMGVIGFRMIYLQVVQKDYYDSKLITYQVQAKTSDVPRGKMTDRNGVILADSKATNVIAYYKPKNIKKSQELQMAEVLSSYFTIDRFDIKLRDKKDCFILAYPDEAKALIQDVDTSQMSDNDIYNLKLERISEELINEKFTDQQIVQYYIYFLMQNASTYDNIIIENATAEDISFVSERKEILRGFIFTYDYVREYTYGSAMKDILGTISTKKNGIPQSESKRLLASDYQMNSRVGTSGLEKQYESLLMGEPSTYNITYDITTWDPIINSLETGQKGSDLRLAIDWELQELANSQMEAILKANINKPLFDQLFFTFMDPNTGDILVMAGKYIDKTTGEVYDYASGNYLQAFPYGSTVKGATVYLGHKYNLISPGEIINDTAEGIVIKGTKPKRSYQPLGVVSDITALAKSSNVYMFHIAMRLGGANYVPNQPLSIDKEAFATLRKTFGELGLGVKTGLDVPYEELGYRGENQAPGLLLDAAIGQYDNYTTIQIAQYVSTIANGGKRVKPRLLLDASITVDGNSYTTYSNDVEILDDNSDQTEAFSQIQKGFRETILSGTASSYKSKAYNLAGKTGTAEVFEMSDGKDYSNLAFVGYAPYDNPKVAFASIAPRFNKGGSPQQQVAIAVLDRYFEKYGMN